LLIHSYFNIVKREMIDMVPKAISLTLVNHSKENLQRELLQELYKPDVLEDLLKESELVVARRKEVIGMVQALNKAEECVPIICLCMFLVANPAHFFPIRIVAGV
jgi:vacuolar protein sorting-associated protein 1